MADITAIPGIAELIGHTRGEDPRVCVAVLDGPVDLDHPCFAGADCTALATLASGRATSGGMSRYGTHVASVIFGRPDGPIPGLAPGCRGLIVPIFSDEEGHLSHLDLARALDPAVKAGAHVINVSGGQKIPTSAAADLLARGDPARPRPERADRRRGRERRLRLSARLRRGGVHRGGAPGPLHHCFGGPIQSPFAMSASTPPSPCRGRRRDCGRPRPPRSGANRSRRWRRTGKVYRPLWSGAFARGDEMLMCLRCDGRRL